MRTLATLAWVGVLPAVLGAGFTSLAVAGAPLEALEDSRYEEAVAQATQIAEATKTGPAMTEGIDMGPLVSEVHFDKVQTLIQAGIDEGARLTTGGTGRPGDLNRGYFARPTVFADVTPERYPDGIPLDLTVRAYRSYKGDIEAGIRRRVLVDNPARLYGFEPVPA